MPLSPDNSTTVKCIDAFDNGFRVRRGRPRSPDSLVFVTVGLTPTQWAWLRLWFPTGSPTDQLRALFERALKFWPAGPGRFR